MNFHLFGDRMVPVSLFLGIHVQVGKKFFFSYEMRDDEESFVVLEVYGFTNY